MSRPAPRIPFADWPLHLFDERFGYAWYTEPSVLVIQTIHPEGTVSVAESLHDAIEHVLQRCWDAISANGGLLIIHDWRSMRAYTSEARVAFLARMRRRERKYLRQVVVIIPDRPLLRMAVQTANLVMALSSGGKLRVATEATAVLAEYGIQRPLPGAW